MCSARGLLERGQGGAERAQRERDVSEKGVYCLTRSIGLNCLNLPKKSLKTNN